MNYLTRDGYEKLKKELDELVKLKQRTSLEIGEAMEHGDLRENAAYTAAKEKQAEVLLRIGDVENKLKNSTLIETLDIDKSEVRIGAAVTVKNPATGTQSTYILTGGEESDPVEGKISVESPLAQALLGKKIGDTAVANLPAGRKTLEILKVEY